MPVVQRSLHKANLQYNLPHIELSELVKSVIFAWQSWQLILGSEFRWVREGWRRV